MRITHFRNWHLNYLLDNLHPRCLSVYHALGAYPVPSILRKEMLSGSKKYTILGDSDEVVAVIGISRLVPGLDVWMPWMYYIADIDKYSKYILRSMRTVCERLYPVDRYRNQFTYVLNSDTANIKWLTKLGFQFHKVVSFKVGMMTRP